MIRRIIHSTALLFSLFHHAEEHSEEKCPRRERNKVMVVSGAGR